MKILKKVIICVTTVIFVILTTVPFAAVAQTLNPDGTVTVKDPDNPNATIIITDPNGDGKITIADSTAILQGNTAQSALMALCKRKATSKSADRIEISRISFARLH